MIYGFGIAVMCLAWLIPGHYFPWTGFQQETVAAAGASLVGLAALASTPGLRQLPLPRSAIAALALGVVPLMQWALGGLPYFADALLPALYLAGFALTVVASAALAPVRGTRFTTALFGAVLAGAILSAVIGLAQWLQVDVGLPTELLGAGGRVFANFTQPNHLATALGLGIVSVTWLFETRRVSALSALAVFALLALVLVTTQSRTAWLFCLVVFVWWALNRRRCHLRTTGWAMVGGLAAFAAATVAYSYLNAALDLVPRSDLGERTATVGARAIHWATLWDAVWQRPLAGWGWMGVGEAQQALALGHPASHEWIAYSHNIVLDLLLWNGPILGGAVCIAIAFWLWRRGASCADATGWCLLAALAVMLTHAMLEFPHAYAYFLLPAAVIVGVLDANVPADRPASPSMSKWSYAASMIAASALVAWIAQEYLLVEETSRRLRFKEAGYVSPNPPRVPDLILLDNQREFLWFRMVEARPSMAAEDLKRMRTAMTRFAQPGALLRYALASGLNGRPEESLRSLKLICQLYPVKRCEEGRSSWQSLQKTHAELRSIEYPSATRPSR
jgi:O-antigen ligase